MEVPVVLGPHVAKEHFGPFPAALATLDGADWDAMDRWEQQHLLSRPAPEGARP